MQYEDLGLTIKVTPHIHGTEEVTLELETEYKALAGQTANAMPIVGSRKFTMRPRLRFGEAALVAGLISTSRTRSRSGIPGLIALPLLSERQHADERVELLLTLRPALLNAPPEDVYGQSLWVGSEGRPAIPLQ
jgi:type II secretory pathway component GspD/PulD (secretin)